MLKFGKKTSSPQQPEEAPTPKEGKGDNWFKTNRYPLAIAAILVIAFLLRFVFAFGLSGNSDFALSGGAGASERLHTITEIMSGSLFGVDGHFNYPFGASTPNGPFIDIILAGFACIFQACGMSTIGAASAALGWSAVIFGVLACIPMYMLTMEITGNKKAACLAALFLAICPVVISQTVFSNGTDIGFIAFMFLWMVYFLYKGLKLMDNPVEGSRKPMVYSVIAGIFFALIVLSTYSFFVILQLAIVAMAVIIFINRFREVDLKPLVLYFSVPIIIGIAAGAIYYIPAGLWSSAFSGSCLAAIIGVALCAIFAGVQKYRWTATIPAIIIGTVIMFILLAVLAPDYFSVIVYGNSPYISVTASDHVSLSMTATYFGFVTMWFLFAAVVYRVVKIRKNIGSLTYLFALMFMAIGFAAGVCSSTYAVIFAPAFALCFALVMVKWIGSVDFKGYKDSFRGTNIKTVWKKLIKPVPFLTILAVVLVIAVPNVAFALDASTSTNDTNNPINLGSVGYYVKTNDDYVINPVFQDYAGTDDKDALVTWLDYSGDAVTFGKFNSITDLYGKGAVAASNILLSDSTDGSAVAAMLMYVVTYTGIDNARSSLVGLDGMTAEDFEVLKDIVNNPGNYREEVINDTAKYGALSPGVTNENIMYLRSIALLTDNYTSTEIAHMFDKISSNTGKHVGYIMITPSMLPMYYGYSSIFSTIASINGYQIIDNYGTVAQFQKTDWTTQYYGMYSLTENAYNSIVWRGFIGKSPAEAGLTDNYAMMTYINGLTLSDGTYKATPGFGLSNFDVDYSTWYVEYNEDNEATLSSSGWTKMLYTEAIAKQDSEGGLINYLAGYPVFMKYQSPESLETISIANGTVVDSQGNGVPGVRVAVMDENGLQRSTVFTDEYGQYSIYVPDMMNSTLEFAIGSKSITGGTVIKTVHEIKNMMETVTIPETSLSGTVFAEDMTIPQCTVILVGQSTGYTYSVAVVDGKFEIKALDEMRDPQVFLPDTYEISVKSPDGKDVYGSTTYLTAIGENSGLKITLDKATVTVTVKDSNGNVVPDVDVTLASSYDAMFKGKSDKNGVVKITVIPGTYVYTLDKYISNGSSITVKKDADESVTLTAYEGKTISVTGTAGEMIIVSSIGYQDSFFSDSIVVPKGVGGTPTFGVYSVRGNTVFLGNTNADSIDIKYVDGYLVSGKLQKSSSEDAVGGTITFIRNGNEMVTINATADKGFSIRLPAGTYTVYATNGSEMYLDTLNLSSDAIDETFKMTECESISGSTYWVSSSYPMQFMPIDVKITSNDKTYEFSIVSNINGSYQFYIPKGATFEATAKLDSTDVFYYKADDSEEHTTTYTRTSAGAFKANVNDVELVNDNVFPVLVDGETIEPGASKIIALESTSIAVIADYAAGTDGFYYYFSGSVPVYPTNGKISLKVEATKFVKVDFTGADEKDSFSVTPIKEETEEGEEGTEGQYKKGDDNSYFFEDGKKFEVRVLSEDKKSVWYWNTGDESSAVNKQTAAEIRGYVGADLDGTITINGKEFAVTSGRYTAIVYKAATYSFEVEVKDDKDNVYTASKKDIVLSGAEDEKYTYNFAVVNKEGELVLVGDDPEPEEESTVVLKLEQMTGVQAGLKNATLTFTATIDIAKGSQTYLLKAGSAWNTLEFYDEEGNQITSINLKEGSTATVKCVGTINVKKVAQFDENLTVIVSELDGTEVCHGGFETDENWERTTPGDETTKISYGSDVNNDAEYQYAMILTNEDNFTKVFKVNFKSASMFAGDDWILMVKYDDKLIPIDGEVTVEVKGYSTVNLYIKVTSVSGKGTLPGEGEYVTTEITETSGAKMFTEEKEGITVSGSTATVKSEVMVREANVDYDVDGRGMTIDRGSAPIYLWVIVAIIILMILATVWLGMRRGVFTRKK